MKKIIILGISIVFLSCSKNSPLETSEIVTSIDSKLKTMKSSDTLTKSDIKSILNKLDFGTIEEKKALIGLLKENQKAHAATISVNKVDLKKSALMDSQSTALEIAQGVVSHTDSEWDSFGEMEINYPTLTNTVFRYKWTVAYNIAHWFFVKSQERLTLRENPKEIRSRQWEIDQPTFHETSFMEGFSAGISWIETSNLQYDGIFHVFLACEGKLNAYGFNFDHGSRRYCSVANIVRSGGRNISKYD